MIGILTLALLWSVSGDGGAQCTLPTPGRNVVMIFIRTYPQRMQTPITVANVRPLIAYVDGNNRAVDWLADGVMIVDIGLGVDSEFTPPAPQPTDVDFHKNALRSQLVTLADIVRSLRAELRDPGYRLKVYLSAPYLPGQDNIPLTQQFIDIFTSIIHPPRRGSVGRDELELVGLYWIYSEDPFVWVPKHKHWDWSTLSWHYSGGRTEDPTEVGAMQRLSAFAHSLCLEAVWIPFLYSQESKASWRRYGFDRVALQPHFAFDTSGGGPETFFTIDDSVRRYGFSGVELEMGIPRNPYVLAQRNPEQFNALMYLQAADQFDWAMKDFNVIYFGPRVAEYVQRVGLRDVYDAIYRFVSIRPLATRLPRQRLPAIEDTFTEALAPNAGHGAETRLVVGWDGAGNFYHTYLRFDLPPRLSGQVLAARIRLTVQAFTLGAAMIDLDLRLSEPGQRAGVRGVTLAEALSQGLAQVRGVTLWEGLTWNGEPHNLEFASFISIHRIIRGGPTRYSFDVTEQVRGAIALGKTTLWFLLSPRVACPTPGTGYFERLTPVHCPVPTVVAFYSRESPAGPPTRPGTLDLGWNPSLELIVRQ